MEASAFNMLGPVISLGLAAAGSCVGCGIAGMASHAVMARVEEGHGKFIAMAAAPSSQVIYGFLLMLLMSQAIKAGTLSPLNGVGIGIFAGIGFMFSAMFQGKVAAAGILAASKQPAIAGKCFASIGVIESIALFVFVFAMLLI